MTTSREMTTGPALPLILNFTLPLLLGNLLQQTYSLVDAAIVGQFLGIDALAGVGASSSVIFLILGFCNGCCCGFGIPVAQRFGARDYADMRRYVANALRLAVGISVTVAIVTSIWCADILHAMRTPDNIFRDAYLYLLVTLHRHPLHLLLQPAVEHHPRIGRQPHALLVPALLDGAELSRSTSSASSRSAGACWERPWRQSFRRAFQPRSASPTCTAISRFCAARATNGGSARGTPARCWRSDCRWDCSSRSRPSAASCSKAPTTPSARPAWRPSRPACASRCSSSRLSRASAWRWPPTRATTTAP